nr:hypothetical protein [Tanacetum cinerariifolium]
VYQKNEAVFEEDVAFLKYDVKTSLGYDSPLNKRDLSNKSDVFESASDSSVNESEEDNNQTNDMYKIGEGYHAVPPSYSRNFMPLRSDLSFAGLDDSVFKSAISETVTSVNETKTSTSKTSKTATIRVVDNEEQQIITTFDGKEFAITEASVRIHLQLADADSISVLPNTEIFDQLSLMGYVSTIDKLTFQKGKFSPEWRFLIHTILHYKAVYKEWDNNVERATTTAASLDAAHDSGNILKTQSTAMPNVPLPQGIIIGGTQSTAQDRCK